ncbi:Cell division protein FtsI (Peptidoglycan synthetase) [Weissella jogaejeotgali]|uniref:Cell division protein FtsI (Peptidoglycan synthetase) n=1 Tax=Weissella jogaejeotgali TaxID=1631871 RepID=A0A1L6RD28_9LACO|nr:penicillin-binding protein 2 [Weissella jogaejeotgali]APS42436.1 Cell division protein FtsI (Peptidoglycan synthetase) [Weissella jogaejeotgali]
MRSPKRRGGRRKTRKGSMSRIPVRLNVLMGIVILMLVALGWRLVDLQITDSAKYKTEVTSAESSIEKTNVQRGLIYDSTGKVLVTNKGSQAITYTKPRTITDKQMYKVANQVGKYVTIDTSSEELSAANFAKYYIQSPKHAKAVAKASGTDAAPGTDPYVDALTNYIEKHQDKFTLTDAQKNRALIFQKMSNAYSLSTVYLKEDDVKQSEIANIGERQSKMPGVRVGIYYTRDYPEGEGIKSLVGGTSTSKSGLPSDSVNELLTKGYSRDDIVGTSYLEKQYEDTLKGSKGRVKVTSGNNDKTNEETLYSGQAGGNLNLTINNKFQNDVEQVLKDKIPGGNTTGAYAVVLNPKTGGVYASAGVNRDSSTGSVTSDALSTVNQANVVGSVVKPATITTGFMNNVITPQNSTLTDQPIKVAGTSPKTSWWNQNGSGNMPLTADQALMMSSNTYVMQVMLKLGGLNYSDGMSLSSLPTNVFQTMRDGFSRFGLGVKTGIDLPGEITGIRGETSRSDIGKALDESFGQYDTYTTMQLAQYVATIANGGYRIRPHIVQSITTRDRDKNKITTTVPSEVMGTVNWTSAQRQMIWDGMNDVVHSSSKYATGTGLKDIKPGVSAKTGTAETFTNGQSTLTSSLISFVPNSDVALAIVVPGVNQEDENVNQKIAKDIYKAYWKDVQDSGSAKK